MNISGFGPTFAVACLGGALAELLKWYKLRELGTFPDYARSKVYWVVTALMVAGGGLLAVLYGVDAKNALIVLQVGLSAPLLIRALADSAVPEPSEPPPPRRGPGYGMDPSRTGARSPSLLAFLAAR